MEAAFHISDAVDGSCPSLLTTLPVKVTGGGEGLCSQAPSLQRCKMQLTPVIRGICISIFFPKRAKLWLLCFMGTDMLC